MCVMLKYPGCRSILTPGNFQIPTGQPHSDVTPGYRFKEGNGFSREILVGSASEDLTPSQGLERYLCAFVQLRAPSRFFGV